MRLAMLETRTFDDSAPSAVGADGLCRSPYRSHRNYDVR